MRPAAATEDPVGHGCPGYALTAQCAPQLSPLNEGPNGKAGAQNAQSNECKSGNSWRRPAAQWGSSGRAIVSGVVDALARKLGPVIVGVGPTPGVADGAVAERFNVDPQIKESLMNLSLRSASAIVIIVAMIK